MFCLLRCELCHIWISRLVENISKAVGQAVRWCRCDAGCYSCDSPCSVQQIYDTAPHVLPAGFAEAHCTTRTRLYRTASSPPPPLELCRTPTAREWFVMETAQSLRRRPWGICKWRSADCSRPPQPSPCAAPRARRAAMALDQTSAAFRDASPPVTTQPWSASRGGICRRAATVPALCCGAKDVAMWRRWMGPPLHLASRDGPSTSALPWPARSASCPNSLSLPHLQFDLSCSTVQAVKTQS
jgi:hypothetical protein